MKYPLLTSPLKIGNTVLKSRLLATRALPHFLQGGETHPTDSVINYYANIARNGAAIVTVSGGFALQDRRQMPVNDMQHAPMYDPSEPAGQNYFSQLAEAIHFHGSLASIIILMLWFFVCANILVLGNVVNYALTVERDGDDRPFTFYFG